MITKVEKIESSGFLLKRDAGSGTSYWGDNPIDLPDLGARVRFNYNTYFDEFNMLISFGYTSPSYKDYSRSLNLNLLQVIELRDYLNECITSEIIRRESINENEDEQ